MRAIFLPRPEFCSAFAIRAMMPTSTNAPVCRSYLRKGGSLAPSRREPGKVRSAIARDLNEATRI
jgi:hypothetical protein